MTKRNFRRLGVLTILSSSLLLMCAPAEDDTQSQEGELLGFNKTSNWNDRVSWKPKEKVQPKSIQELQSILREKDKVRLGGSLHSLNESLVADKGTVWVDMKGLNRVDKVQKEADGSHTVWVDGGATVERISGELAAQGFSFENLPTSKDITIGGAIANAVHGSSRDRGAMLVDQVVGMEIVDTEGNLHTVVDEPTLKLVRVGIGSLGATARVKLRVVEDFQLVHEKIGGACSDMRKVVDEHDHAIIWYDPVDETCAFDVWDAVDTPAELARAHALRETGNVKADYEKRSLAEIIKTKGAFALADHNGAVRDKIRREAMKPVPATVGDARFQFQMWLDLPARDMSYAIPYKELEAALKEVKAEFAAIGYTPHFPFGMRVERVTDTSIMAPNYGVTSDDRVIHVETLSIMPMSGGDASFAAFEKVMLRHQGRTHWGKEFSEVPKLAPEVRSRFETVRAKFDPKRKLVNEWVARYVLDDGQ
ncbi:MAG TPA: FAD-binding oxidoreductase [Labilithrix sp.]|nr:FAD-binding oxidoreductase [Labilithrix sp.]